MESDQQRAILDLSQLPGWAVVSSANQHGRITRGLFLASLLINILASFLFHIFVNMENGVAIKNTYEARVWIVTRIRAFTAFSFWNPDSYVTGGNGFVVRNNIAFVLQSHVRRGSRLRWH
ncbi:MAG: hypothetical protein IPP19_10060 [Verrucomicrobia bacterium]|nr:hypothetical protein [Verrucomicrobiota bacterium]